MSKDSWVLALQLNADSCCRVGGPFSYWDDDEDPEPMIAALEATLANEKETKK